ncbi:MAG TPA: thioredoxin family protein [Bacteroidia bacterium]|nr:thioredoxin family protein [Bacteroidia bacterium]HQF27081.1 thioredoxin family protein [Bacteroidia bacterium]HQK97993.1 thioredoxin family protein [Bacteroidia bacterium]
MKKVILSFLFVVMAQLVFAQEAPKPVEIYHPDMDAKAQIQKAVAEAKSGNKHVFLMVGGNWCKWCRMFEKFIHADAQIDSALKAGFVMEHINFSKENKNEEVLASLSFPQRFGFPVFVILDAQGNRIHTQNSGYLEEGEGYSKEKVIEFFKQWSPDALNPANYK